MPRSRKRKGAKPHRRLYPIHQTPSIYHLDTFTVEDIRKWKQGQDEFIRVHWDWYSELAYQRSKVLPNIKEALSEASVGPFDFTDYQRAVKYKWSLDPLSVRGSIADIGGRFNIGEIDRTKFPVFPALYLGQDRMASLQELLQVDPNGEGELTAEELALTDSQSVTIVSMFGSLETIIDLDQPDRLKKCINLIKDFKVSEALVKAGRKIGFEPNAARDIAKLIPTLLDPFWRRFPMHVDVPANSQLFGQLVSESGIDGIKYPSKYPRNLVWRYFPKISAVQIHSSKLKTSHPRV